MSSISYNNKQIYSTETSKVVTLECSQKRALSDIVIVFTSNGAVTYLTTKTSINKGQTAILKCANKLFKGKVVCEFIGDGTLIKKLATPTIYLSTADDSEPGTEAFTPAILGKAILGKTILGKVVSLPQLDTPSIKLITVEDGEEPTITQLATPVIELVLINDGDEPEILKLATPVIRLEIVEDSGEEPDAPTEPIKLNTPVIYLETVSDGGEEPSEPDIPEVPEIIKLEAPVIRLEFEQEPEEPALEHELTPIISVEKDGEDVYLYIDNYSEMTTASLELYTLDDGEWAYTGKSLDPAFDEGFFHLNTLGYEGECEFYVIAKGDNVFTTDSQPSNIVTVTLGVEKLATPIIRLEVETEGGGDNEGTGGEEEPTPTQLAAPAIELITVEEQEPSLTKLDAPIIKGFMPAPTLTITTKTDINGEEYACIVWTPVEGAHGYVVRCTYSQAAHGYLFMYNGGTGASLRSVLSQHSSGETSEISVRAYNGDYSDYSGKRIDGEWSNTVSYTKP